ncbi:MAG: hypothetical protein GWM87_15545, partial [Xanthomonadales bacterium]|nr:hypothetical protein [Xanthomonadales bacterium]NIX14190.1 hypothetical protein [Xanthomonadales bacterium]
MSERAEWKALGEQQDHWEETTLKDSLDRHPERMAEFMTTSSAPVERLYTPL